MTTVKAPTFAASVNRLIRRSTLSGEAAKVDFRTAAARGKFWGIAPLLAFLSSCGARADSATFPTAEKSVQGTKKDDPRPSEGPLQWQEETRSPVPGVFSPNLPECGEPDEALERVAARVARHEERGLPEYDAAELAFALRAAGSPHVWPHAWTLSGENLTSDEVAAHFSRFASSFGDGGVRRCGIVELAGTGKRRTVAAVVVDSLADLDPVPTEAHAGEWIRFSAAMRVPTTAAKLVVLGPLGAPRTVPTTLHAERVESTFAVSEPGQWTLQLVATFASGPRPVLEAVVFVDTPRPAAFLDVAAPGESAFAPRGNGALSVHRMVNAAREAEGLPSLAGRDDLDRVATAHAVAMQKTRLLAHDAGDGDPFARLRAAGIELTRAGENVAHAQDLERAHRALWASPSHRSNLLDPRFHALGVGVAEDAGGGVWVCEVFGDFANAGIER
jgi:uncharacterized protein YkwD